jgi:outer membrane protein OmpA-like peptidoglycan-associated protein
MPIKGDAIMKKYFVILLMVSFIIAGTHCASWSKKEKGAAVGGASGAVLGGVIGKAAGSTLAGAIIGAAVGGAAGYYIGNYMDKQAAEIERDIEGAKVERMGEGIKITFDSGILFDVDSKDELAELAMILNKYADTNILIEGHTDSTGSEEYNLTLSKRRSESVSNWLAMQKVDPTRFTIMGYGMAQPVAPNETAEGRALNRRVDVGIMANDKLKKVAKEKTQNP